MCGHVGIAGKLELKDETTLKRLLIFDYFRGPDSTGLAAVAKDGGSCKIAKIASHPLDLFDTTRFKSAANAYNSSVFMGHNRAATRGAVNTVGAHPFEFEHIVGCHNGTLTTESHKELESALGETFEVDSAAIFAAIAKFGINDTMKMLQGAWALVWFDFRQKTLNFLRNKERPFWYAYSKEFDKLFWASEYPMIRAATSIGNASYDLYVDKHGHSFWATGEDMHFRYDLEKLIKGGTKPKPAVRELKGKAPTPVVRAAAGAGYFPFQGGANRTSSSGTNSRTTSGPDNVVSLFGDRVAPFAGFITKQEFDRIAKYGCSWCGCDVDFEEPGVTIFEKEDAVLCPSCTGEKGTSSASSRVYTPDIEEKRNVLTIIK